MGNFVTPPGPPLVQAASLALALMRATGAARWAELVSNPGRLDGIAINEDQLALLNEHRWELQWLKNDTPRLTLAVCPACARFSVVTGAAPASCLLTMGCPGKPIRVTAAAKWKPADDTDPAQDDGEPAPDNALDEPAPVDDDEPAVTVNVDVHAHVA